MDATATLTVGSTVKLSIRLPVRTWWRLKHHMADRPDLHEGGVIAPLLDQYLGGFDYPKQPDWLLAAMKGESRDRYSIGSLGTLG